VTPAVLEWCISTGRFYFLKDTCCDMAAITQKLNISKNSGLKIYNANSATVLDSLKAGAAGFSGIMGNMQPELYVWLYSNYSTQIEKAQKLQHFLTLSALVEAFGYPCCAKYYMRLEGLDIGLHSRSVNPEAFGGQDRLNMRHLHELTMTAKSLLKINDEKEFIS
jgi:4-hydroxy-tetrahydrodipicolinate synthase